MNQRNMRVLINKFNKSKVKLQKLVDLSKSYPGKELGIHLKLDVDKRLYTRQLKDRIIFQYRLYKYYKDKIK